MRVVEISLARTRRGRFQGVITVCLGRALKKARRREGGADGVSIWFLHMTASRGRLVAAVAVIARAAACSCLERDVQFLG